MIIDLLKRTARGTVVLMAVLSLSIAVFAQDTTTMDGDKTIQTTPSGPSAPDASARAETFTPTRAKTSEPDGALSNKNPAPPSSGAAKQADPTTGWQFGFAPYLYFSGLEGTVGARGRTTDIDLSVGDVLSNFDVGLMGVFEARKGRFVLVNDLIWIRLSKTVETPGNLFSSIRAGANQFILNPQAGYRLHESKKGSVDLLGGVRMMSVENTLSFRAGTLPAFDGSDRKTWASPVVGLRGLANLSPKFFVNGKFDVGGGFGVDYTGQVYGGVGYRINPKIALVGGWRYMTTKYDNNSGFVFDTRMNGLVMGAMFNF